MARLGKEFCTPTTSDGPWGWWLGCSGALRLWSNVHRKSPEKPFCPSQICCTESELEIVSLCSPMRSRGAPDLPCDQLLTGWWYPLRGTMLVCYKFVTAKCHLKMERQLLAHCYSNQFATTVCKWCRSAQLGPPLSQLSLCWRCIISSPFLKLESSKGWPLRNSASLVSSNSKESKTAKIYLNPMDGNLPGMHTQLGFAEGEGKMYTQVKIKNLELKWLHRMWSQR